MPHKSKVKIRALKASGHKTVIKWSKRARQAFPQPARANAKVMEVRARLSDASSEHVHVNQRTKGHNAAKMYGEK
jgi:hypothetical protein